MPKTMFDKIWHAHVVREVPSESTILYIDRHLVHEVTSPQAFAGLRAAGLQVRGPRAALAVGIGTSEVEQVLATQCLLQQRPKTMNIRVEGKLGAGITAKDLALAIIGELGIAIGTGHVIEFSGSTIRGLSMEGRMTLC